MYVCAAPWYELRYGMEQGSWQWEKNKLNVLLSLGALSTSAGCAENTAKQPPQEKAK